VSLSILMFKVPLLSRRPFCASGATRHERAMHKDGGFASCVSFAVLDRLRLRPCPRLPLFLFRIYRKCRCKYSQQVLPRAVRPKQKSYIFFSECRAGFQIIKVKTRGLLAHTHTHTHTRDSTRVEETKMCENDELDRQVTTPFRAT
jgi:hypothetical protein